MNISNYKLIKTGGFPFDVIEKSVDKQDYVFPDTLETNVTKLHEFLYGTDSYTPSDKVSSISKKIDDKRLGSKKNISNTIHQETPPIEVINEPETEETISQIVTISEETKEETNNMTEAENNIEPEVGPGIEVSIPEEETEENYGPGFEMEIEEIEESSIPS